MTLPRRQVTTRRPSLVSVRSSVPSRQVGCAGRLRQRRRGDDRVRHPPAFPVVVDGHRLAPVELVGARADGVPVEGVGPVREVHVVHALAVAGRRDSTDRARAPTARSAHGQRRRVGHRRAHPACRQATRARAPARPRRARRPGRPRTRCAGEYGSAWLDDRPRSAPAAPSGRARTRGPGAARSPRAARARTARSARARRRCAPRPWRGAPDRACRRRAPRARPARSSSALRFRPSVQLVRALVPDPSI